MVRMISPDGCLSGPAQASPDRNPTEAIKESTINKRFITKSLKTRVYPCTMIELRPPLKQATMPIHDTRAGCALAARHGSIRAAPRAFARDPECQRLTLTSCGSLLPGMFFQTGMFR